jgi:type IV secretory pathway VirB2 component (pilin)
MIETIINEMLKGNFSFLILVVGIMQLCVMIHNKKD